MKKMGAIVAMLLSICCAFGCLEQQEDFENENDDTFQRLAINEAEIQTLDSGKQVDHLQYEFKSTLPTRHLEPDNIDIRAVKNHFNDRDLLLRPMNPQKQPYSDRLNKIKINRVKKPYHKLYPAADSKAECPDCEIGGECYDDGQTHPTNVCLFCDVSVSTTTWTDNDDAECEDGLYCNGSDYCMAGDCTEHKNPPCPNNGLWCDGIEVCNETNDTCSHEDAPDCSDDGLWCNGLESCNEDLDQCVHEFEKALRCPDDGNWCNGQEYCDDQTDTCLARDVPDCSDDGKFCNGEELCNETLDQCEVQNVPSCNDDGLWCNGEEFCDEENKQCSTTGSPCDGGEKCDESDDSCYEQEDTDDPDVDTQQDAFKTHNRGDGCCGCGC